ncbi:MAG: hypothetical protein Q9160_002208 [Pyrenula sp. 1 TL-2023]
MDDSGFDDFDDGSDFDVSAKPKAKAAPKAAKKAVAPKKPAQKALTTTSKQKAPSKKRAKPESENEMSDGNDKAFDDESLLDDTPPKAKKAKKEPTIKKGHAKPLGDLVNEEINNDPNSPKPKKGKRVSEQYQMLTHIEHITKRPDTYIGSVERQDAKMWVYNTEQDSMEYREVSYVPGLYKIFDEILVNAADNKQNDKNMDTIKVTVDREKGEISVWNNGRGIPVEIHSKQQIYIPEMIFGHLLTSSNYDDDQQKITGGRNGYGAKLCNVFSTQFTIETVDSRQKKKYKQTWTDNMSKMGKARITDCKGDDDYTKVTFTPDFSKFGMTGMDEDFVALIKRRVYDIAATTKVAVRLNGSRVPIKDFKKYMAMFTKAIKKERGEEAKNDTTDIVVESDGRWEIGFAVSDGSFQHVSFVNSIATTSGGTHVNYVSDQICNKLADVVKKKNKGGAVLKPNQIRNHVFLFVNCLIVNPAFTSQTKEQLTTKSSQFGSKYSVSEEFLKKVQKTEVIQNILAFAQQKADQILKKSDGSKRSRMNNPKLVDANNAGTKEGHRCTLILTEGDSAKGLAMAGRSVVGPDLFGVFPLRGKLLNVRDASIDQISKNAEIQNIKNFLGLQHKKEYTDLKGLRYGHLMIMTDQDHDGSHIKGLLINFLQVSFPSLLRLPEFLIEFITPIVKVYKGDPKNPSKSQSFFTMPEYEAWKEAHTHERGWEHKYYKGLGTSTTEDAQVYFTNLDRHLKEFHTMKDEEAKLIDLAFSKKKADERKEWLREFKPGTYLDHSSKKISYTDFINKELILFSMADNLRSIPSVVDGFKPGQRKVLYSCFKRNLKKDMKVVELAGYVSGLTAYQHGEASLQQTIVGLAQTFVGSNNVNCLEPSGNFGSRLQGGSDCASARYIYTRLSPFARKIFHTGDEPLLTYNTDDDRKIEPEVYVPVVPMVLINGADGIGTGWSSSIPNYNPEDIVSNLKLMMDGQEPKAMQPWFRAFAGDVTPMAEKKGIKIDPEQQDGDTAATRFKFSGKIAQTGNNEVEITELPIRVWTQDFKDRLEEIIKAEKTPSFIKDYKDYNTHDKVHFVIQMEDKHLQAALNDAGGLEERFKLSKSLATTNLVAFDTEGRICKYNTVEDMLKEFFQVRIKFYEKRKQWQLSELQKELEKFNNQARFVLMIIDGKLNISKKKKAVLIAELKRLDFKPFPKVEDATKDGETELVVEEDEDNDKEVEIASNAYDYLLGMPLWSLTQERVDKLRRQVGDKELEIDALIKLTKEDLWTKDLDDFIEEWRFQLDDERQRKRRVNNMGRRASSKLKLGAKAPAVKKRKALGDDPDDSDFGAPKPKNTANEQKRPTISVPHKHKAGILGYLNKLSPTSKANGQKVQQLDGADSDFEMDVDDEDIAPVVEKAKRTAKPKSMAKGASVAAENKKTNGVIKAKSVEQEEDSSVGEVTRAAPSRQARTARKPINYGLSDSDSDNGDDLLGDVGKMVKGIGEATGEPKTEGRALFSSSLSRPGSSAGLKPTSRLSKPPTDFSADDTDYSKLVPQQSPRRSILVTGSKDASMTDDEEVDDDDDLLLSAPKPKPKAKLKATTKRVEEDSKPLKPAAKAARGRSKKGAETQAPAPTKKLQLSPAAKAYAAKQAKANKRQKDDSDEDADAMADDILSSEASSADNSPPPQKPASRPARRTAATKAAPKYIIDDDSDEDEGGGQMDSSAMFSDDDD